MTIAELIARWTGTEGGAERANYQMFLSELTQALDLPLPNPKGTGMGEYVFEAPVKSEAALGKKGTGRIDLYKQDCFILEAKQSQLKPGEAAPAEPAAPAPEPIRDLFGTVTGYDAPARPMPRYDRLMADARLQAERYALALPGDRKAPPFLIVADIGRAFELYFDWSSNGRGYAPFPDERSYRIALHQLADPAILPSVDRTAADLFRAIWTDPAKVDPRLRAAEVTRDVAQRLSRVAEHLELTVRGQRGSHAEADLALGIEQTSLFLMRLLFCMFAEDVAADAPDEQQLLRKGRFTEFLRTAVDEEDEEYWLRGLTDLFTKMNTPDRENRYWSFGRAFVRYFNGNLFASARAYPVSPEFRRELLIAAGKDWRKVEPAIFGTLLEQVLTVSDRAKLGAHYTPRAYVERLVDATMMEVLRPEWEAVLAGARAKADAGDNAGAIADALAHQRRLHALRVLDPACGTGNFLYVAMEQVLRLEGEVRQFAAGLGTTLAPLVEPNQFLGLELNPRAAVIAELVLWIGWLRYRLTNSPDAIGDPVLPTLSNINRGLHGGYDAVLARTATGEPDTDDPRQPEWPEADFIVGNPPFIGGSNIRERLGGGYAEALWRANPRVPKSADFVMQWWDRAAHILTRDGARLRRFGFVTTNSIAQVFSRRVIEAWLSPPLPVAEGPAGSAPRGEGDVEDAPSPSPLPVPAAPPSPLPRGEGKLHLTLAIADHPWTRVTRDAAAVRIAMTVAEKGAGTGKVVRITSEQEINTDVPMLGEEPGYGAVNADLSIGTDLTHVLPLKANDGLCSPGVKLHGAGFIVTPKEAAALGLGSRPGLENHIRHYRNGRDMLQRPRGAMVIDMFGLSESDVMDRFPEVADHLLTTVKPERDANRRETYRKNWWVFGEPRRDLRSGLTGLSRYIATTETSKHRVFQFVDNSVLADNMIVVVADDRSSMLGVLSSHIHAAWVLERGGWLGFGNDNRYSKSLVFDPFPFPAADERRSDAVGQIAERLDATRRTALAENPSLTMTGLYNFVAAIRGGTLAAQDEAAAVRARARIVAKLHDDLDEAVAAAYGWEWPLPAQEIVARLVALNAERAAEEAAGTVRWLRPDYQKARFGKG